MIAFFRAEVMSKPCMTALVFIVSMYSLYAQQLSDYVNTNIGTMGGGNTFATVTPPHGFVQPSPFRPDINSYDIIGVSTINIGGNGCHLGGLGHIIVTGNNSESFLNDFTRTFPIRNEVTKPEIWSAEYVHAPILHETSARVHSVLHRITFNEASANNKVMINLGTGRVQARNVSVEKLSAHSLIASLDVGGICNFPQRRKLFVYLEFEKGTELSLYAEKTQKDINTKTVNSSEVLTVVGKLNKQQMLVKVGLSHISETNAKLNADVELLNKTFEEICAETKHDWDSVLSIVQLKGGTNDDRVIYYSSLYRGLITPSIGEDVNGEHLRFDSQEIDNNPEYVRTITHDLWGTSQTLVGTYALLYPTMCRNIIRTLNDYTSETGVSPQFDYLGINHLIMGGDPYPLFVLDAVRKGIIAPEEMRAAHNAMRMSAYGSWPLRPDNYLFNECQYLPCDVRGEDTLACSVANTLEYCQADRAIAILANSITNVSDEVIFLARANRLWNVFDSTTGYFRERKHNGKFREPFFPDTVEGYFPWAFDGAPGFKEGSARDFLFFPQEVRTELAQKLGGWPKYEAMLDTLFTKHTFTLINQPQFHIPFQYLYISGRAHKSQSLVYDLVRNQYNTSSRGLPGNDDLGSTSMWYVMTALGLYPTTGFECTYLFCVPVFDTITIQLQRKDKSVSPLNIISTGSPNGKYIASVTIDGMPWYTTHIRHEQLMAASTIVIERSVTPVQQPMWWNRKGLKSVVDTVNKLVSFSIDDNFRQTSIQVHVFDKSTGMIIKDTVLLTGENSFEMPFDETRTCIWSVRDLADPSGENAWVGAGSVPTNLLGVGEGPTDYFTVGPNPTDGMLNIRTTGLFPPIRWNIYNTAGALISTGVEMQGTFSIQSGLASGSYILELEDASSTSARTRISVVR